MFYLFIICPWFIVVFQSLRIMHVVHIKSLPLISCRQAGLGATPEGLLTKVEEEVKVGGKFYTFVSSIEGERVHCEGETAEGVRGA